MIKLELFTSEHREEFINLWNRIFCDKPKFSPLNKGKLEYILTKPNYINFDETTLLLIYSQERLIGFIHFFIAPQFLKENFFNTLSKDIDILLICNFGIDSEYRGKGIATNVFNYLIEYCKGEANHLSFRGIHFFGASEYLNILSNIKRNTIVTIFDTRNLSHFWGNALYPDEILWGHPEGIGILDNDIATKKFVEKFSRATLQQAVEFRLSLSEFKEDRKNKKIVSCDNTEAILGESIHNLKPFKTSYFSRTFLALSPYDEVLGYIIIFPLKATSTDDWGIYELNVLQENQGIATALLCEAVDFLKEKKCKNLYTVTIPSESPRAVEFYKKHNFKEVEKWLV